MIPIEDGTRIDSPQLLPDGGAVLFTLRTTGTWDNAQVVVQSLRSGERTVVLEGGSDARYVPTGHLVYALGDRLFGIAFDVDSLSVTSAAVPLVQGLQRALLTAGANYGVSVDGTLAYISGERVSNRSDTGLGVLVWVDRVGRREAIDAPVGNYRTPRVSPDGTRIVMTYGVGDEEGISVYDLARGTLTRMPDDSDVTYIGDPTPIWSPDGLQIAYFARGETGGVGIFVRRADGIGVAERLSTGLHRAVSWSPDGARLTSTYPGGAGETRDVGVVGMTEGATGQPLLASPTANEGSPFVSPDGEWIAYVNGNRKPHICGNRKLHTPGEDVSGGADILPVMPVGRVGLDAGSGATGVQPNTRREAAEPAVTLRLPHAVRPTLSSASADAPASGSCCPGC